MLINNVYTIQSFRGGISDENDKGIRGSFKFGYGLDIRGRDDALQCGQALVKESGSTITELINFIVSSSDGSSYHFGNAGGIYKRTSAGVWSKVYSDSSAILGADEWNGYFYWATATALNEMIISGNWTTDVNSTATWPKTLTSASWHTMIKATGNLLICNDQYLAMVDYATAPGTFTANALDLIPGNLAKCFEEDGDYVIVGSTREGNDEQGHLWTWEPTALNWIQKKKLASKGVNGLITTELMLAQCGIDGEVYFSDMASKVPVFVFPDGGFVIPGGVDAKKALALFGISGNSSAKCGVYSYGRGKKNLPFALNLDYVPSPAVITGVVIGAVKMVNGTLLVAWQNGSSYGVDALSTTAKASGVYESLEWNGGKPFQKKNFFQTKIVMDALTSGCSIVLKYKINRASSWTTAKTIDGGSSFSTADGTRAIFNINAKSETIELRIELTPISNSTPVIRSVNTYFNLDEKILI